MFSSKNPASPSVRNRQRLGALPGASLSAGARKKTHAASLFRAPARFVTCLAASLLAVSANALPTVEGGADAKIRKPSSLVLAERAQAAITPAMVDLIPIMSGMAVAGSSEGLYFMARLYWTGAPAAGIEQSPVKALEMMERAAEMGHGAACTFLGDLQWAGDRVVQDPASAVRWFERGVAAGDSEAALRLARIHEHGVGGSRDAGKALSYYLLSANGRDGGTVEAASVVGFRYLVGSGGLKKNEMAAIPYLTRAADGGDSAAAYNLGLTILNGEGTVEQRAEGLPYIIQAAKGGVPRAAYVLAALYMSGEFVGRDMAEAEALATAAFAGGVQEAASILRGGGSFKGSDTVKGPQNPVVIVATSANVRSQPSTESAIVDALEAGVRLEVEKVEGAWALVKRADGRDFKSGKSRGWLHSALTRPEA